MSNARIQDVGKHKTDAEGNCRACGGKGFTWLGLNRSYCSVCATEYSYRPFTKEELEVFCPHVEMQEGLTYSFSYGVAVHETEAEALLRIKKEYELRLQLTNERLAELDAQNDYKYGVDQ